MTEKKTIAAVIFDCDGVMFDSRQANVNFYNHILKKFDLPPMEEEDIAFVHMHPAKESVSQIFKGTPYVDKAEEYRLKMDYTPFIKDMIIEPDLKELLGKLKPDYGLAIATNRSNTIQSVLETFGLSQFFDIVVSSLDVSHPKPHPESLFKILDYFSILPHQALYIGDSIVDYETAQAAGVPFVSYCNEGLEAQWKVEQLHKIFDVLRGL